MIPLTGHPPPDDVVGCLQDVHWAVGSFGYFPSYTVGNLYAAQLFAAWWRDRPDGMDAIAAGQPEVLRAWLHDKVYQPGHRWSEDETIRRATGSGLDAEPFLRYLAEKYTA
jgi:carboxypeptidase Taq